MPPKVLVFGPPRMGTQSLCDGLQLLGCDPMYHMREVGKNGHPPAWVELLDQKFDRANHPEGVDYAKLEQVLQNFEGIADYPASLFVAELLKLYPQAHVILTRRDEDGWIASMNRTLIKNFADKTRDRSGPMQPLRERYHAYAWQNDFEANGRSCYREYATLVRKATAEAGRPLLEFDVRQGWEPLCGFLGKEIPEQSFPNNDEARRLNSAAASTAPAEQKAT